ncbi:MAG: hypothetical protein SVR08_01280 [Spirochaetota bacterium]|nr:hypothetical protein [Spirochaetota bacterium]
MSNRYEEKHQSLSHSLTSIHIFLCRIRRCGDQRDMEIFDQLCKIKLISETSTGMTLRNVTAGFSLRLVYADSTLLTQHLQNLQTYRQNLQLFICSRLLINQQQSCNCRMSAG